MIREGLVYLIGVLFMSVLALCFAIEVAQHLDDHKKISLTAEINHAQVHAEHLKRLKKLEEDHQKLLEDYQGFKERVLSWRAQF